MTLDDFLTAIVAAGYVATEDPRVFCNGTDFIRLPDIAGGMAVQYRSLDGVELRLASYPTRG
jgi:hypothetical protein